MPATCWSVVRGKRVRVTTLDPCGTPPDALAEASQVVSSGFISVEYRLVYEDGDEYTQKNADGFLCINDRGDDVLKRVEFTISFCNVDPELLEFMTGNPLEVDGAGNSVGFRVSENATVTDFGFELWSGVPNQPCVEGEVLYGYFLLPWAHNGTLRDFTVENGPTNFEVQGWTKGGGGWGVGPYNVVASGAAGAPSSLEDPLLAGEHLLARVTTVAPPAAVCGAQAMPAAPTPAES